jgi:RNA polymerase sigma-70 factor (ECF subfamily)
VANTEQPTEGISEGASDATAIRLSLHEPEAFATLFERHFKAVHNFASRRAGPELGEEVAAETFARAFDTRARYDLSYRDARPWLLGITSNILRRHWRTERHRLEAEARLGRERDATPPVEAARDRLESSAGLIAALGRLPRNQREVVLLYALCELSYEDIANALSVPIGTVRSRLSRARRRLGGSAGRPGRALNLVSTEIKENPHV